MRCRLTLAVAAGLVLVSAPGSAQAPAKDAQASYEPRSRPGEGQKLLQQFVGDWDVAKTFHPRNGEPVRSAGSCRQTMIHDGRFLQSEFVFGEGERKSTGLGVIGFEPESGVFTSFWTDSRQTRMSVRQSRDKFDGRRIVLYSRSLEPAGPATRSSKTVSHLEDDGRKLIHRQYALGANGEERLMMELVLTRRARTP
jgi:hypothetical protein